MDNETIIKTFKDDNNVTIEIHTFNGWLKRGYAVRKGEKAKYLIPLWQHSEKSNNERKIETFAPRNSFFFDANQVEPKTSKNK